MNLDGTLHNTSPTVSIYWPYECDSTIADILEQYTHTLRGKPTSHVGRIIQTINIDDNKWEYYETEKAYKQIEHMTYKIYEENFKRH